MKLLQLITIFFLLGPIAVDAHAQMIIGHRGASHDAPENTLAAFEEAWLQQADGVEGDFYYTSDDQIVCIHDQDTLRTGGSKLSVMSSTLAQLQRLEYGAWKSPKFKGERLPVLADVLKAVPEDKHLIVELKTGPSIVPLLVEELGRHNIDRHRILVISFDDATVAKSKELMPDIKAHWLTGYKQDEADGSWHPSTDEIAATLRQCRADGLGTKAERSIVDQQFIEELREKGMREFHVWTVDSPTDALYFQGLGAMGITTNRPALIRAALAEE